MVATFHAPGRTQAAEQFCEAIDELGDWVTKPPGGTVMTRVIEIAQALQAGWRLR